MREPAVPVLEIYPKEMVRDVQERYMFREIQPSLTNNCRKTGEFKLNTLDHLKKKSLLYNREAGKTPKVQNLKRPSLRD